MTRRILFASRTPVRLLSLEPFPKRVSSRSDQYAHQLAQADLIASRWAARNPNYLNGGK